MRARTIGALAATLLATASAPARAGEPTPMPEMYSVSLANAGENKDTKDAFDAFIRRVQQLGQQGRAGRIVLRFGETASMLGGLCVEFVDEPTAAEALKPLREVRGVAIQAEKCM